MRAFSGRSLGAALVLGAAASAAQAGLFDDEEARKAILDLRGRVSVLDEQLKARGAEVGAANAANAQLQEQIGALRRSLLDLNNQIESLRGEIARLRGSDEQLTRDVAELQRRQADIGQAADERLRKLEPVKVSLDGREFTVAPGEKKAYDDAIATIRSGDFDKAVGQLTAFLRRYVGSPYGDSARFWMGNALYGKRDYKEAIAAFRTFLTTAPDHPRAPEALLAVANSQAEMKDAKAARKTIDELVKAYPSSEAAQAGKDRLASLK